MKDILKEKINEVMQSRIKNIHHSTQEKILSRMNEFDSTSVKVIETIIRDMLSLTDRSSIRTSNYWIKRGWSLIESKVKIKEYNKAKPKRCSPFSREFWMNKINPDTGLYYSKEEADYKRNSSRPIKKEYWLELGYSEDDAIKQAKLQKINNNTKGSKRSANRSYEEKRGFLHTSEDYWILRGFTKEEARVIISTNQATFSLKKCIEQYGGIEGNKRWSERQHRWKESLKKSGLHSGYSAISQELFKVISNSYPGLYGDNEYIITGDKMTTTVDFTYNNKVIEFMGDYWHANPQKFKSDDKVKNRTASEIWEIDKNKQEFIKEMGYELLVVWESDYKSDRKGTIDRCLNFLKQ